MRSPLADLHVHTVASGHAYSTVGEVAAAAAERGLELVAITDHGPGCPGGAHPYHFWNLKALPRVISGVRILKGVEANVTESANGLDLEDDLLRLLDFVAVGFHPGAGFDGQDPDRNTEALLRSMANPHVDMVTHPGNGTYPVHPEAVVEAALRHDVILEVNDFTFVGPGSRVASADGERAFAAAAAQAGAKVAICSDAHFHLHVGRVDSALAAAEEAGVGEALVVNLDADRVVAHLTGKRERPRLDEGGQG